MAGTTKRVVTAEQRRRLKGLPGWAWTTRVPFDDVFVMLKSYAREHGDSVVPFPYRTNGDFALGKWVSSVRGGVSGTTSKRVSDTEPARLETLPGWVWTARPTFAEVFTLLQAYVTEFGHARAPRRYRTPTGSALET